ncbi:MAG: NADH-quinone oxidoreductase subunit L [Chthonomonadaceae bacterium]|nr:NADH-quinone oxidoreductase subunit L [Chthonomonadaceae bacterium]
MKDFTNVWWILFLPLAGFLFQALGGKSLVDGLGAKRGRLACGALAVLPIATAFLFGLSATLQLVQLPEESRVVVLNLFDWIKLQSIHIPFEFRIDTLSMTMVLIITGIGSLIHLYAVGYMSEEKDFPRFFTYLNLFIAAMLILVLGNNLVMTFMGWEGVGLCSYLLIGFWFRDLANSKAANKAFIVNRVGDWGFTLGMFGILSLVASSKDIVGIEGQRWLSYDVILPHATEILARNPAMATAIALLLFVGAMGKSAQFPLYVWLPDAMAGPTPVSALIHAATMVTSGVYLLNRMSVWFLASPTAMGIVALVGALTALIGASIAFGQSDIKKVLAFSTVSQLGYMFIGCGVGAFWAGMFHVITHAFFKALLFLGSGAVIHAMAHNQDMRNYGNLRKYLPITFITMLMGWIAIVGVPFVSSGAWSKEAILEPAVNSTHGLMLGPFTAGQVAGWVGFFVAALTACYMTRMLLLTFFNPEERWKLITDTGHVHSNHDASHHAVHAHDDHGPDEHGFFYTDKEMIDQAQEHEHHHELDSHHKPHEVPALMWVPLAVLAVFSLFWVGAWLENGHVLKTWLTGHHAAESHDGPLSKSVLIVLSFVVSLGGIAVGWWLWAKKLPTWEGFDLSKWNPIQRWAGRQWGIDNVLSDGSVRAGGGIGTVSAWIDKNIIDGAVNMVGGLAKLLGGLVRQTQTGNVRSYALFMQIGIVAFIGYLIYVLTVGAK